jgi:hypothetical protein
VRIEYMKRGEDASASKREWMKFEVYGDRGIK